jgi:hypothetical protein
MSTTHATKGKFQFGSSTPVMVLDEGSTQKIGVFNVTPVARQAVTGSRGGNAALASLITAMASYGWVTDSSSA